LSRKTAELRNFFLRPQRGRPSLLRPQHGRPSLIPPATRTPLFAACSATAEPICTINRTTFIMRGASAAPMPRHRSASTGLRSTTATAVPKHGGRSTSFHQLCLCAKSFSTARLCRDAATILPTRRLIGHRATQIGNYGLFVECPRSTTATAVPAKFAQASSLRCCDLPASFRVLCVAVQIEKMCNEVLSESRLLCVATAPTIPPLRCTSRPPTSTPLATPRS